MPNDMILNMTATQSDDTAGAGHNSEGADKAFRAQLRRFGQAEAMGSASRPLAAALLVERAYDGGVREGDAEACYAEYQAGLNSVAKKNPLTSQSGSEKVQISKFRQFIKLGMLPAVDGRDVMSRTGKAIEGLKQAEAKIVSPFDAMLAVARKQIGQPEVPLTDAEIEAICTKPEKQDKEYLDKLIAAYKSVYKINADTPAPATAAAVQNLADAITEAGGDLPAMTKAEKERAEFMAQAAKFGVVITPVQAAE